jgi:hypothetical protein
VAFALNTNFRPNRARNSAKRKSLRHTAEGFACEPGALALLRNVVVMMMPVMMLSGERRHCCGEQQNASQDGNQRFFQRISSTEAC